MGVGCSLVLVDHVGVVERGLPVLNLALQLKDPAPLREYILRLNFPADIALMKVRAAKVAQLRELKAPDALIAHEERMLAEASGAGAMHARARQANLDDLRAILGRWGAAARTFDLDKTWDLVHWFADPARRNRDDGDYRLASQRGGARVTRSLKTSTLDLALYGRERYPVDSTGTPVIRTGGNPDRSYYNPPTVVREISMQLLNLSTDSWAAEAKKLSNSLSKPYLHEIKDAKGQGVALEEAKRGFSVLKAAYDRAAREGLGVSCEWVS